jgi:hypothetical protein
LAGLFFEKFKIYFMKKRHPLLFVILLTVLLSVACNLGRGTRIVSINNGQETLRIEYKGEVYFSADETAIEEISPEGFIKYNRNNKRFIAEPNDSGNAVYKLYAGDRLLNLNDTTTKEFFKAAMSEIVDHYQR